MGHSPNHGVELQGGYISFSVRGCLSAGHILLGVNGVVSYSLPVTSVSAVSTLCDSMLGITTPSPNCVPTTSLPPLPDINMSMSPHPRSLVGGHVCSGCSSVGEYLWVQGCGWGATGGYLKSGGLAA